jgi:Mg-chelatase subunit ChlI
MKAGDANAARTALQLATQPPASPEVRADAYYDLGVSFFRDADAHAGKNEHEDAQKMFREAADAFKQSLRLRSGDHNTAWNYELSARRVVEQQEKQKQKEQQDKDKQKKDDQKQDDQKQDPQSGNDSQDKQDDSKKDPQKDAEDKQKQQDKQAQDKQAQKDKPAPKDGQKPEEPAPQPKPEPLRPDVAQALDSLQDGEQNLERLRAMQRAASERRSPEKDW